MVCRPLMVCTFSTLSLPHFVLILDDQHFFFVSTKRNTCRSIKWH